jgi:hypothetical protein
MTTIAQALAFLAVLHASSRAEASASFAGVADPYVHYYGREHRAMATGKSSTCSAPRCRYTWCVRATSRAAYYSSCTPYRALRSGRNIVGTSRRTRRGSVGLITKDANRRYPAAGGAPRLGVGRVESYCPVRAIARPPRSRKARAMVVARRY